LKIGDVAGIRRPTESWNPRHFHAVPDDGRRTGNEIDAQEIVLVVLASVFFPLTRKIASCVHRGDLEREFRKLLRQSAYFSRSNIERNKIGDLGYSKIG